MKRIIGILVTVAMLISAAPAYASSGGIAGQYYSTDIRTFLNGAEIDSINIDGQTLISAEDMEYYSFAVYWYGEARQLSIEKTLHATSGPPPAIKKSDDPTGTVLGNYYETDIVTLLDGEPVTAYNVGGRTYILAEQMRDWGYVVDWNEAARTLSVTSPDRAGYEYGIKLSEGNRPETDASEGDGEGAFAISYKNGKLTGCGDAALFDSTLSCDGIKYTIYMSLYQNEGLFFSAKITKLLDALCYLRYDTKLAEPEEKYGFIDENTSIVINGHKAENIKVMRGGGNGHTDFEFEITNIPIYKKDEIESICFSAGNLAGTETYDIEFREREVDEFTLIDQVAETLKKYPEDFVAATCYAENYAAVYMCESPSLGVIKDRLYIINRETQKCSEDVLEQVRQIEGFSSDRLKPFAFKVGANQSDFFFSCSCDGRTGDFYVDTETGIVYHTEKK